VIIPSIDLMGGRAVQLVGGERLEIDAGDPRPIMERFRVVGEVAVIDLDAAMGTGSNAELVAELCRMGPCRVGGGIRSIETAVRWLDAGASKVILGTAARPEILRELPRERVIAALDARNGVVVDQGWKNTTGRGIFERLEELRPFVSGFLVTTVEREGRLGGADMRFAEKLAGAAGDTRITLAGGVTVAAEIGTLDRLGCDAQVGMALYSGRLDLGDAVFAPGSSDRPDGLMPTVIVDERGVALGLVYSDAESVRRTVNERRGIYRSRTRGMWIKGETSGDTQELLKVDWDCDRDCLRFTVRQAGRGNCHLGTRSCWGGAGLGGDAGLGGLERRIARQAAGLDAGSYTKRLLAEPGLLDAKLREEINELIAADGPEDTAGEAADVLFFVLAALSRAGVPLEAAERELDRRALKVSRRKGDAKPAYVKGAE
jgi:phosphoribosyl-ATP pyrophosphohydrolase/phosphoribosyl-AMP cyclohydrolase